MKVKELIEALRAQDPEAEVVMQKDAEGNGYSPLCGAEGPCPYSPESTWSGEVYREEDEREMLEDGMSKEHWDSLQRVVVLYPVN